jgi:hypothetical protein
MRNFTSDAALRRLHEIIDGIDKTEVDHPDGWWETQSGASAGHSVKLQLEELIGELTS